MGTDFDISGLKKSNRNKKTVPRKGFFPALLK